MALPDPGSANTWGGKLLVDRDGAEIGICTQIFVDDDTGLAEWATAEVTGGTAFIPLVDAVESGPRVRVVVRGVDVADAPRVGDGRHLSEDEEERLYRHYGIQYSRTASQTGLPAEAAPSALSDVSSTPSSASDLQPEAAGVGQDTASARPDVAVTEGAEVGTSGTRQPRQARALLLLGVGIVASLGALAGAVLWSRRRRQPPATRAERLSMRARAASSALDLHGRRVVAAAVPVLRTGSRLSVTAAQAAAMKAATQAAAAAEQASALASRVARSPRAARADEVVEPTPTVGVRTDQRRRKALGAVKTGLGFGAGYLLGSRAGRMRLEQVMQATATWSQRPAVQQARTRVRVGVPDTLQARSARLTQRTANVAGKLRRRPGDDASSAGDPADTASTDGSHRGSPDSP